MSRQAVGRLYLFNLTLLFLVLAFVSPLLAAGPGRVDRWEEINSPNFHVITDSGRSDAVRLARRLEVFRDLLARRGYPVEQASSAPTTVVIFHRAKDMAPYGSLDLPEGMRCVGSSLAQPWTNYLVLDAHAPREDMFDSAYRGYMQLVFANGFQYRPLWFRTGMTEYYRTFRLQRGTVRFGEPIKDYLMLLRTTRGMPMEELFAVDEAVLSTMEERRRDLYTAQSWGMVHYLFASSGNTKLRARAFLQALVDGAPMKAAFVRHFETDFDGLAKQFHDYLESSRLPCQLMKDPAFAARVPIATAALSRQDLYAKLGLLLVLSGPEHSELAEKHFDDALAIDPEHALALTGLALAKDQLGEGVEAERLFQRAVHSATPGFLPSFLYARHLQREWSVFRDLASDPWCEVREKLGQSIESRPEFFPARLALASSYLEDPHSNPVEALAAVEQALSMRPWRSDLRLGLALLHMQAGDGESARKRLEEIRPQGAHEATRDALARHEFAKARQLLRSEVWSPPAAGYAVAIAIPRTPDSRISHEYPVVPVTPRVGVQ